MRSHLSWLLAGAALVPLAAPALAHAEPFRFHYDHVLGTSLDLTAVAPDEVTALMAVTAAKREIERLDRVLSAWRLDSELEHLNRSDAARVSPELFEVIARSEAWRAATNGAFDCRMGGPLKLWREAEATGAGVDAVALDRSLAAARQDVRLDAADRTVHRPDGVTFTVDGMAKGYVIDAAMAAARKANPNLRGLVIDIGGDLRCWGAAPQAAGWSIGVAGPGETADNLAPTETLRLGDRALASSGRGARDLAIGDRALSHSLAPASGLPTERVTSAVAVAGSAADADALATAFMVMSPNEAIALADRSDGVEAMVTDHQGVRHTSRGWTDLVDRAAQPQLIRTAYALPMLAAATAGAQRGIGLDMTYQVPKIDAEPYHAPYVVVWVTDESRQLVRTLMVLGAKPRWVPENYVWWRRYGRQLAQPLESVARPTRLPGRRIMAL